MNRTKKSIKNIVFGFAAQIITTILTFFTRTVMLDNLGLEVISINSLFNEVIATLSVAELGIGSAIVYNLYKPLAEKDERKVCQLMTFFKQAYRVIAGAIFLIGMVVTVFIPLIVKDIDRTDLYLQGTFILFVINISCSYLFSYKFSLLNADQNNYLYSLYSSILQIFSSGIAIAVMFFTKNYIAFLLINIAITLSTNLLISKKVDKVYSYLKNDPLPKEDRKQIFGNVKNIFIKELSGKITGSTDNLLISTMISTIIVGKYSFYSTILAVLKQFSERINENIRPSMGNLFASCSDDDCLRVLHRLTWGYCAMAAVFSTCFYACSKSFIKFWVGEEYLLAGTIVFILTINLFCYISAKPIYSAMHVSGLFVEGRNISIIGSVVNLAFSIILAQFIGLEGIFIGTFSTYFIQIVMKIYYVYKLRFHCSSLRYVWLMSKFSLISLALIFGCDYIGQYINTGINIIDFFIKGIISALISVCLIILLFHRNAEYQYYKSLAMRFLKRKNK